MKSSLGEVVIGAIRGRREAEDREVWRRGRRWRGR
jgi:hypothetical protein